jgi:hypothetical protein
VIVCQDSEEEGTKDVVSVEETQTVSENTDKAIGNIEDWSTHTLLVVVNEKLEEFGREKVIIILCCV